MYYYQDINEKCRKMNINNIITNDIDAWSQHQNYRKIYNKLWLVEKQNIDCAPIGVEPKNYPIIIKPIINLYGMSRGFKKIDNRKQYYQNQSDGCFWMPFLKGKLYTVDLILDKGKIVGNYCLESKPSLSGTFEYHVYRPNYKLTSNIINLIETNFKGYSGPMNIEIINNIIIEGHLRLNGDYYIYNDDFLKNLSNLIDNKEYQLKVKKKKFYLFPYFVESNFNLNILNKEEIEEILREFEVKNIRWDNIKSLYQRDDLTRLLMFKVNKLNLGNEIKKNIRKNLFLRNKMYDFIYNNGS